MLCVAALFALVALAAPSAMANVLNLKTAAGSIASGQELKATSSNVVFKPEGHAAVECASSVATGELKQNQVAKTKGLFSSITYENCKQEGKAASIEACASSLPWLTTLAEVLATYGSKVVEGATEKLCLKVKFAGASQTCAYGALSTESTFNIGGAETITTTEQEFLGPEQAPCVYKATLSQTSTLTSKGEAVEAVSEPAPLTHPDWWECAKNKAGKLQKGCITEGPKGGFERRQGIGKGKVFKGKGGKATLHTVIPTLASIDDKVECASFKDEGKIAVPNLEDAVHVDFRKCASLGHRCTTVGASPGEIRTEALAGALGWITAGTVAGLDLANEAHPGTGYVAQFECEGLAKARVLGSLIGAIGPINVFSKSTTVTFTVGNYLGEVEYEPGKKYLPLTNVPQFEGGPLDFLGTELNAAETGFTWQPPGGLASGEEATATDKGEDLEIAEE
jgi:hypothetical protein